MKITINNMAIIIVFRFAGIWFFNITLSHAVYNGVTTFTRSITAKGFTLLYILIALWPLLFIGCGANPTAPAPKGTQRIDVITRYVSDSLEVFKSCYYPWAADTTRDSLIIDGKRYTVSERSRYRLEAEPETFGDVEAEGPVILMQEKFFLDTKSADDSILVLNRCGLTAFDYHNGVR